MKNFYLLIVLSICSIPSVIAQYECNELAEIYYLKEINTGGINQWISYNDEVTNVTLTCPDDGNGDFNFVTTFCKTGRANVVSNGNGTVSFLNREFIVDGESCVEGDNPAFENAFYSFFTDYLNEEFTFQYGWIHGGLPPGPEFIIFLYIYNTSNEYVYFEDYPNGLLNSKDVSITSLSLSPNPTKDILNINYNNQTQLSEISIFSITGALVETFSLVDTAEINIAHLKAGIYFTQIITEDNQTLVKKIIKK